MITAGALVAAMFVPVWPALSIHPDGASAGHERITAGEQFGLSFVHSVDHLPVEDWYRVDGADIVQESTRLRQFGAGMGHIAGVGRGHDAGDWWEITGMERHIGELVVRVGSAGVDHQLHLGDRRIPLTRCWAGQRVTVSATRISTLRVLTSHLQPSACEP